MKGWEFDGQHWTFPLPDGTYTMSTEESGLQIAPIIYDDPQACAELERMWALPSPPEVDK